METERLQESFLWAGYVPVSVGTECHADFIDPATLQAHDRRALWEGIKAHDSDLAELLTEDAGLKLIKSLFLARVLFAVNDVKRFLSGKS